MPFDFHYQPIWISRGHPPRTGGWHLVLKSQRWHLYCDLIPLRGVALIRACDGVRTDLPKRPPLLHLSAFTLLHDEVICESCRAEWDRLAALPVYVPSTPHR